jgi:hypothetical protein
MLVRGGGHYVEANIFSNAPVIYYEGQGIFNNISHKKYLIAWFNKLVTLLTRMSVLQLPSIFLIASIKVTGFRDVTSCSLAANYTMSYPRRP